MAAKPWRGLVKPVAASSALRARNRFVDSLSHVQRMKRFTRENNIHMLEGICFVYITHFA
jgi:hypothetical protein